MDFLSFIPTEWVAIIQAAFATIGAIVALASLIVPLTKTPKDDEALASIKNLLARFSVFEPKK